MSIQCPQCGFANGDTATHCAACGRVFQTRNSAYDRLMAFLESIKKWIGFADLQGKVISVRPTYYMPAGFNWMQIPVFLFILLIVYFIIKTYFLLFLILFVLILIIGYFIGAPIFYILLGLFLLRPLSGMKKGDVTVQDIIVQDASGNHLVRIMGHLIVGTVSDGDTISVKGRIKKGMFVFRSGYNHTINTELKMKQF
jgi:hypothetical protein